MLAYILGIKKRGNKGITNRGRFQGLQIGARGITNRRCFKGFQIGLKRLQIGAQRFQIGQRLQIGAIETTNRGRDYKSVQNMLYSYHYFVNEILSPIWKDPHDVIYLFVFNLFIVDKFYFSLHLGQPSTNSKTSIKPLARSTVLRNVGIETESHFVVLIKVNPKKQKC